MSKLRTLIVVAGALALMLSACKGEAPKKGDEAKPAATKPAAATTAGGIDALVGNWAGDVESLKKQDPTLEKNPMAKMIFGMLGTMKVEFTKDTMTAEVMGQKKSSKFKVLSSESGKLVIEALDGPKAGSKSEISFIDGSHIAIKDQGGKPGPPMVLKKL